MNTKGRRIAGVLILVAMSRSSSLEAQDVDNVFVPIAPSETVTAPLQVGGVLTNQAYSGLVRIDASGSGTNNVEATDSYYSFERPLGQPVAPFAPQDGSWLAVGDPGGGACLDISNPTTSPVSNLTVFIDGVGTVTPGPLTIPAYSSAHTYSIVIDLQGHSDRLYVGNRDCGFSDNSGALVVTLTMVEPACTEDTDCDDGNACTDEVCEPDAGCVLSHNSSPCDDGDACTHTDTCRSGACEGEPVECDVPPQCHQEGVCQPDTGACLYPHEPDGSPCDDGEICSIDDTCQQGSCAAGESVLRNPAGDPERMLQCLLTIVPSPRGGS